MSIDPDIRRVLDGTPIAHLATVLPDGAPHAIPVWIATHGDHVAILTGPDSRKARNLRRDPRVALSLTPADNPYQPIIIRGRVVEWIDGDAGWGDRRPDLHQVHRWPLLARPAAGGRAHRTRPAEHRLVSSGRNPTTWTRSVCKVNLTG